MLLATSTDFLDERAPVVALAAVAATGAAFAQSTVTLSGKLAFAYEDAQTWADSGSTGKTKGLGVTDGDLVVTATEDLGGGLKATATAAFVSRGRDTDITGRDASITLSGGFGSVMIGAIEAGNGLLGLGGAGAPVIGLDNGSFAFGGELTTQELVDAATAETLTDAEALAYISKVGVLDAASNVNILKYTAPSMGGFTFSVNMTDSTAKGGSESGATTQDSYGVGVGYAAGPLAVSADYTSYGKNSATGGTALFNAIADSRTRISASYDLGVAKLGAGYQTRDWKSLDNTLGDNTQYLLGVSVPMGAFSFGYNYGYHKQKVDGLGDIKVIGHDLGANYALSKRTAIRAAYQTFDVKVAGEKVGRSGNRAQVRLMHTF